MKNVMNKLKYVVPTKGWLKLFLVVFAFVLADYITTLSMISAPEQEGNVAGCYLMQAFGIVPGLTIIFMLTSVLPSYAIVLAASRVPSVMHSKSWIAYIVVDVLLAWFIVGTHTWAVSTWFVQNPAGIAEMRYIGTAVFMLLSAAMNYGAVRIYIGKARTVIGLNGIKERHV